VYDVTSERSYDHLEKWRANFTNATHSEGIPFVLIGNKADMGIRVNASRVRAEWIDHNRAQLHV